MVSSVKKSDSSGFVMVDSSAGREEKKLEELKEGEEDDEEGWEDIDLEDEEEAGAGSATASSQNLKDMETSSEEVGSESHEEGGKSSAGFKDINEMPEVMSTGEIRLPGGKIIGHRVFRHIYKQNLRPSETRESVLLNKLAIEYRQLNGTVMKTLQSGHMPFGGGVYMDKASKEIEKGVVSRLQKKALKIGVFHHKLQHSFRKQTP